VTHVGDGRMSAIQTAAQDGAADASRPHGVDGGVGPGGDVVAVLHDGVALRVVVGGIKSGDVGVVDVGGVGDVDDQRGGAGHVGGVAAEEGGAGVEAEVDEGVGVRDVGEGGAVLDAGGVDAALVGGDEAGAVGPAVFGVGGGVDGEDDVDGAVRLDERVQGDVLQVLAAVDEEERACFRGFTRCVVVVVEGVRGVGGDVVVVVGDCAEEFGDDVFEEGGYACSTVEPQEELVEQGR